ncbi:MAG: GMC family oxidoreductase N-terminal domain-containing protein [bacterium]
MRHDIEDRWLNLKKLQALRPALTPEQRMLKRVLQILGFVFLAATLCYGAGAFLKPIGDFFHQLPFVSNSVVKVYCLMLICLYAAGDLKKRYNLVPIFIAAHVFSLLAMLIFFITIDTGYLVQIGPVQMSIGAVLLLASLLDLVIGGVVTFFYVQARFSLMKIVLKGVNQTLQRFLQNTRQVFSTLGLMRPAEPLPELTGAERQARIVLTGLGGLFACAALAYELGPLLPSMSNFFVELPFVSNSAVKAGILALLSFYAAKDIRNNLPIASIVIAGHIVSALTQLIFLLFKNTSFMVELGGHALMLKHILLGSIVLDAAVAVGLFVVYNRAWQARHGLKFLGGIEYRTLVALAEVLVHGEEERVQPDEIVARVDHYVSQIRARRLWVYRVVLYGIFMHPQFYFRAPFPELDEETRLYHLKKHFYRDVLIKLLPGFLRRFVQQMIRVAKQLTYVGYYSDPKTFEDVGYQRFSQRKGTARLSLRPIAAHPLKVQRGQELRVETLEADVCIMGSGAGGAILAYFLAKDGREVTLVERGKYVEPREFSEDEVDMVGKLYADGVFQQTQDFSFTILQGSCVGGSTVVNNAVCFSPPEEVLHKWNDPNIHHAGLSIKEVYASDAAVRAFLDIQKQNNARLNPSGELFLKGVKKFNATGQRISADVVSANIKECYGCGYCNMGCPYGKKLSMLDTALPWAQRDFPGRLHIIAECEVRRLHANGQAIRYVEAKRPDGSKIHIRAKTFVLSAGAIGSSYLLLRSKVGKSLPVGKQLSFNMGSYLTAEFDDEVNAHEGLQISHYGIPQPWRGFVYETWWNPPVVQALNMPGWFEDHFLNMRRYNHMMAVGVLVGTSGNARVKRALTGGPDVLYKPEAEDLKKLADGLKTLGDILFKAGAERVMANTAGYDVFEKPEELARLDTITMDPSYITLGTGHPQGGNCISQDPKRGVVGPDFRVHGYDNLYICDASVFPSSLTVNPQLTIMALAHYAASRIK